MGTYECVQAKRTRILCHDIIIDTKRPHQKIFDVCFFDRNVGDRDFTDRDKGGAVTLAFEKLVLGHSSVIHDCDIIDGINIVSKSF